MNMEPILTLSTTKKKDGIQFIFKNRHNDEIQFITTFDLDDAHTMGEDLIEMVNNIRRKIIMANKKKKMPVPKGKMASASNYVGDDEEYDKKQIKKQGKEMRTAGISKELKLSEKEQGYSKKPRVKPQKKNMKPVSGNKNAY